MITTRIWNRIPERASLIPIPPETPLPGSHQTQFTIYHSTVSSVLPAAGSTSYDDTPISNPRVHDITPMDV